jgi:serine/threonine-protein phosphatase PP1 catalytic subunit
MKSVELNVDEVIKQLLSVKGKPPGTEVDLNLKDIRALTIKARDIFISQSILLELYSPIKICGTKNALCFR